MGYNSIMLNQFKQAQDSPTSTSAHTTPSHAPTPVHLGVRDASNSNSASNHATPHDTSNGQMKAAGNKKKKTAAAAAAEKGDDDGDGRTVKRGKITYARE